MPVHHEGPAAGLVRALDRVLPLQLLITDQEPVEAEDLRQPGEADAAAWKASRLLSFGSRYSLDFDTGQILGSEGRTP